jgi:ATP-dependent Zn protease
MTPEEQSLLDSANAFLASLATKKENWNMIKTLMISVVKQAKTEQDTEQLRGMLMANLKVLTSIVQQLLEYEEILRNQAEHIKKHLEPKNI